MKKEDEKSTATIKIEHTSSISRGICYSTSDLLTTTALVKSIVYNSIVLTMYIKSDQNGETKVYMLEQFGLII